MHAVFISQKADVTLNACPTLKATLYYSVNWHCVKSRYQGQGQVITSHRICGMQLFIFALDTCFWYNTPHMVYASLAQNDVCIGSSAGLSMLSGGVWVGMLHRWHVLQNSTSYDLAEKQGRHSTFVKSLGKWGSKLYIGQVVGKIWGSILYILDAAFW